MGQQLERRNETVLATLEEGDLIEFSKVFQIYSHWGVYIGDHEIVHLTGVDLSGTAAVSSLSSVFTIGGTKYKTASVKRESFRKVAKHSIVNKNNDDRNKRPFLRRKIKERALLKLGPMSYDVMSKNCEHFAYWCRYGILKSKQVETVLKTGFVVGTISVLVLAALSGSDGNK